MSSTIRPTGLLSQSSPAKPTGPNQILGSSPTRHVQGPTYNNPIYALRNTSGLYNAVAKQIEDMKLEALANLDYPETITRQIEEWSKNHKYLDTDGNELRVAIVGEILGMASGTIIRAHGNHYARDIDNFKPIDDKTKVKDTIAIGIPSAATTTMYNTCYNQNICAGQIVAHNADEDKRKGVFPIVKNWTKSSLEGREQHDIMTLHMLPNRRPEAPVVAVETLVTPGPEDIKLGAFYEPDLLPDFGGDYFNLVKAKLVQQDVRDVNSNLVPPWKIYDALKPGTLILALVSLHCFCMVDASRKEPKDRRARI
ncbi:hypothetical protein B0H15DRAFT_945963 [Mycena belliarum]|uniref:Uncharacterized protein n=1 Tax=Mycena belliarum TaxID=1033014 RepID=A0AAD6UHY7_9AGAR|nr:hypothetical protein B0H15DRAFT_945963 [Mycena belliae]